MELESKQTGRRQEQTGQGYRGGEGEEQPVTQSQKGRKVKT